MKLLLRTFRDDCCYTSDFSLYGLECAVIVVTSDLIRRLENQLKLVRWVQKADRSLAEITFHVDMGLAFYGHELIEACETLLGCNEFETAFYEHDVVALPESIDLGQFRIQPSDSERIRFWSPYSPKDAEDQEFSWTARHNNREIGVHTGCLTMNHPLFRKAIREAYAK